MSPSLCALLLFSVAGPGFFPVLHALGPRPSTGAPASATVQREARGPWVEGEPAPPLRLPTIDGRGTLDLAALRGQRVLLIEFASW